MTLMEIAQLLGNFGEFFGAIAVVFSLVFVAMSVRQNTHALELNTLHDVKDAIREVNLIWAENGDLAEIIFEGFKDPQSLSGAKRVRFYTALHNLFLGYENLYHQKADGALASKHWSGMAQHMIDAMTVPGMLSWWEDRKQWFTDDFQNFIDNEVIPAPAHPGYKLMGT
jgi:hypothetical protein